MEKLLTVHVKQLKIIAMTVNQASIRSKFTVRTKVFDGCQSGFYTFEIFGNPTKVFCDMLADIGKNV